MRRQCLTDRQEQIAKAICQGLNASQIAVQLKVRPNTVRAHRHILYRKLDIHSKVELMRTMYHMKLFPKTKK